MAAPSDYPLDLYRGDTARWQFLLWADAEKTDPLDLNGVTVAAQIRRRTGGVAATLACTVTLPNIVDVVLTAEASSALTPEPATWDLQLTYANGDVRTAVGGGVRVTLDATH
jgi:hypothetical protein